MKLFPPMGARWDTVGAVVLFAGCASKPHPQPVSNSAAVAVKPNVAVSPAPPPVLAVPQATAPVLAGEKRWLEDLFRDTPITVAAAPGASVRVEVPLKYAFDAGKDQVKPPLAAVLDKVAASLNRQQQAVLRVSAPLGARADNVRQKLLMLGVPPERMGPLGIRSDAVELHLKVGPFGEGPYAKRL